TIEQHNICLINEREKKRQRRLMESAEECENRLSQDRKRKKNKFERETPEDRETCLNRNCRKKKNLDKITKEPQKYQRKVSETNQTDLQQRLKQFPATNL
ncbi:595_t:CDS:1, partial [Acaulospora morrowiae]